MVAKSRIAHEDKEGEGHRLVVIGIEFHVVRLLPQRLRRLIGGLIRGVDDV